MARELPEWVTSHFRSLAEWERESNHKTAEGYVAHAASYDPSTQRYCVVWRMGAPVYAVGTPEISSAWWELTRERLEKGEPIDESGWGPSYGAQ